MWFFSGPSKYVTVRMAQGVASFAGQIRMLKTFDEEMQKTIVQGMKSQGVPTSLDELTTAAAQVIKEYKMGTWKKNQFLGVIQAELLKAGSLKSDAADLIGLIEFKAERERLKTP
jgi:hypothetical protein